MQLYMIRLRGQGIENSLQVRKQIDKEINIQIILARMTTESTMNLAIKPDDHDSTSFSSQQSTKVKSVAFIKQLRSNIKMQVAKNQTKYQQVMKDNPMFSLTLYQPKMDKALQNSSQLLAIKLDRLMEDQYVLDKELSKIQFKKQDDEEIKTFEVQNQMNHYLFLRNVWKKSKESVQTEEQIDYINHTVGLIKGHVKNMIRTENLQNTSLSDLIRSSQQYTQLQKQLEDQSKKQEKEKDQLRSKIIQLQQANEKLRQQNQKMANNLHSKNDEKRKNDQVVLELKEKIQTLEIKILQKERELKKVEDKKNVDKQQNRIVIQGADKSFTIILQSSFIPDKADYPTITNRKLTQIKQFLQKKNALTEIIESGQNKLIQNYKEREKPIFQDYSSQNRLFVPSSRKMTVEKIDKNRTQMFLGSQEKRKRFERTRGQ